MASAEPLHADGGKVENRKSVQEEMEAASSRQDIALLSLVSVLKVRQILRFSLFLFSVFLFYTQIDSSVTYQLK